MKEEKNELDGLISETLNDPKERRAYAGHFHARAHVDVEMHVTQKLTELEPELHGAIVTPGPDKNQAPDCVVTLPTGSVIAVEVMELVDQECCRDASKATSSCGYCYRSWGKEDIAHALVKAAKRKDVKDFYPPAGKGVDFTYDAIYLLIYTDELDIEPDRIEAAIDLIPQLELSKISKGYLLTSYSPEVESERLFKIFS